MKFYKVSYSTNGGNHGGFSWHTSRAEAVRAFKKDYDQDPTEYESHATKGAAADDHIEVITVALTKTDVLAVLKLHASHPDNG